MKRRFETFRGIGGADTMSRVRYWEDEAFYVSNPL